MAAAVRHDINLITIIFNDGAFGDVKRSQKSLFGEHYIASDLQNPDFVKIAEAYGAIGLRAETPEELPTTMQEALKANVPVGEFPPWQPFHYSSRRGVRGNG